MKRIIALTALIALLICGCAAQDPKEGMIISGDTVAITLKENPTTGYQWVYEIRSPSVLEYQSDEYFGAQGDVMGAGGYHTFVFKGLAPGVCEVEFSYERAWEENLPAEVRVPVISVGDGGKIMGAQ